MSRFRLNCLMKGKKKFLSNYYFFHLMKDIWFYSARREDSLNWLNINSVFSLSNWNDSVSVKTNVYFFLFLKNRVKCLDVKLFLFFDVVRCLHKWWKSLSDEWEFVRLFPRFFSRSSMDRRVLCDSLIKWVKIFHWIFLIFSSVVWTI